MSAKADLRLTYEQCLEWSVWDVVEWLNKIGLSEAANYFVHEGVDGTALIQFDKQRVDRIKSLTKPKREVLLKYLNQFKQDQNKQQKTVTLSSTKHKPVFKHSKSQPAPIPTTPTPAATKAPSLSAKSSFSEGFNPVPSGSNPRSNFKPAVSEPKPGQNQNFDRFNGNFGAQRESTGAYEPYFSRALPSPPPEIDNSLPPEPPPFVPSGNLSDDSFEDEETAHKMADSEDFDSEDSFDCVDEEYLNVDDIRAGAAHDPAPPPIPNRNERSKPAHPRLPPQREVKPIPIKQPAMNSRPAIPSPDYNSTEENYEIPEVDQTKNNNNEEHIQDIYEEPETDQQPQFRRNTPPQLPISSQQNSRFNKPVPNPPTNNGGPKQSAQQPSAPRRLQQVPQPPVVAQTPLQPPRGNTTNSPQTGRRPSQVPVHEGGFPNLGRRGSNDQRGPLLPPDRPVPRKTFQNNQIPEAEDGDCIYVDEDRKEEESGDEGGGVMEEVYDEVEVQEPPPRGGATNVNRNGSMEKAQPRKQSLLPAGSEIMNQLGKLKPTTNGVRDSPSSKTQEESKPFKANKPLPKSIPPSQTPPKKNEQSEEKPKWALPKRDIPSPVEVSNLRRVGGNSGSENTERSSSSSAGSETAEPLPAKKKFQSTPKPAIVPTVPSTQSAAQKLPPIPVNKPAPSAAAVTNHENGSNFDEDPLLRFSWYCGDMKREDVNTRVKSSNQDGAFLVRKSQQGALGQPYTLCLNFKSEIYNLHLRLREKDQKFAIGIEKPDELIFEEVEDLIKFYCNNPLKLYKKTLATGEVILNRTIISVK